MCIPKDFGGMDIIDTRVMNEALIGKWGWRILQADMTYQCIKLLHRKYLNRHAFFQVSGVGCSQFWKGVLKAKDILKWGCQVQVNNRESTRFWEEVWVGDIPLKLEFPTLHELCRDQDSMVSDNWAGDGWNIEFRRALGEMILKSGKD